LSESLSLNKSASQSNSITTANSLLVREALFWSMLGDVVLRNKTAIIKQIV